ncbi:MAG: DMT family transporter [Nitrosopumilus sp.]|nr:DMT family transporter [Nitrosopumilus sp.]
MNIAYFYLLLSAILYGSISTIAKPTLNTINPILLSSLIYLIIGISLTIVIKIIKKSSIISTNNLKLIFITSICGSVVGPILFFYGLKLTNASLASLLINTEFLFSILLAISILKEKPNSTGYAGILVIFMGLLIINLNFDTFNFLQNNTILGNIFIIGAALFWALDNNISNIILKKGVSIIKIIQLKSLIGGLISLAICILFAISFTIHINQIPNLVILSLGGFAGSLFLFLKGMKEVGTIKSVMIFSTSSIFGIIFALVFLNEKDIGVWKLFVSSIFMIVGIFLITKESNK